MNKCFITKLPSSVDNDNLPVLGQLRINWPKQSDLTDNDARAINLSTNDSITIKVSGAHLTDNTLLSNLGNSKTITKADGNVLLYISNDADAVLTIDNKYSLTCLNFVTHGKGGLKRSAAFDINDIRYCTALVDLELNNTQVSGDISAVSQLTALVMLSLGYTQVSGKIDSLANLTNLPHNLSEFRGLSLTGDMSKIPAGVNFISQVGRKVTTNFTWTANGRKNATLLAMEGSVPFDTASMDNMLIDQATCTFKATDNPFYKTISVSGTRTSASDAAVTALQNMGVTITGVSKVS